MKEFILFLQDILMIKPKSNQMIGLSQLKLQAKDIVEKETEISIKTKNVKLSDLMRRAS